MSKAVLVIEALLRCRPVLAFNRAFKKPPTVPSATLRPVVELQNGYRAYTTPLQIQIAVEAFFVNRRPISEEPVELPYLDLSLPPLSTTVVEKKVRVAGQPITLGG